MVLKAGFSRMRDSSIHTRKKAIQLIATIIDDVWPEGSSLKDEHILLQELNQATASKEKIVEDEEKISEEIEKETEKERV